MASDRSTGAYERKLIAAEVARLLGEAREFSRVAREVDDRFSDSALDAGQARADEAERLMTQLDRAGKRRPPRGRHAR